MQENWSESLRYEYPLNKDSVVFDIGGFEGICAENIFSKYACDMYIFEPVKEFYHAIKSKFAQQDKIQIFNYGLGNKDETINIELSGCSTSVLSKTDNNNEQVEIKDIEPILSRFNEIPLVKINIEGAEYDLLDYIIEKGLQTKLVNIQIQFHNNVTDYENRRDNIRKQLSKTHHLTYDFPVGLHENWQLK